MLRGGAQDQFSCLLIWFRTTGNTALQGRHHLLVQLRGRHRHHLLLVLVQLQCRHRHHLLVQLQGRQTHLLVQLQGRQTSTSLQGRLRGRLQNIKILYHHRLRRRPS